MQVRTAHPSEEAAASKQFIDLTKDRFTLSTSTADAVAFGKLSIEVLSCTGLDNKDSGLFGDYTDPFVCICYGPNYVER